MNEWNNNPSMAAINQCNQLLEAEIIRPSYKAIHEIFTSAAEKSLEKKKESSTIKRHKNKKNKMPKNGLIYNVKY